MITFLEFERLVKERQFAAVEIHYINRTWRILANGIIGNKVASEGTTLPRAVANFINNLSPVANAVPNNPERKDPET